MDKFTFESDEHGTFTADAVRVTELINFWNFRCGPQALSLGYIQEDVANFLGYTFEHMNDVGNRFAFAIMLVSCESDEMYMRDSKYAPANRQVPFSNYCKCENPAANCAPVGGKFVCAECSLVLPTIFGRAQ